MADDKKTQSPLAIIRLAPIGGLIFIILSVTVVSIANVLTDYPLFHPLP
jgi:hypothetical protein